jgi:rod shape-determining protein MreC
MCAVTPDGVVGVVARVEPFQSYVYTLHHADCKVGATVRRNRVRGIVHGSGSEFSRICTMRYLDLKDDVRPGDEVVTGGGGVFPTGYPIGKITAVHGTGSLLKTAYVEPDADPYRLDEVFIVKTAVASIEELAETAPPEAPPRSAYAMPDERPLQERFAP